jgi:GNAT superfamily N-acetyltransferase
MIDTMAVRLERHLDTWLGRWPPRGPVDVVGSTARVNPGWDGRVFPMIGVSSPTSAVLSVAPERAGAVSERARTVAAPGGAGWSDLLAAIPRLLGRPSAIVYSGIFRWCEEPAVLPDAGVWVSASDPDVPAWLRPFGHEVLIAADPVTGGYLAGVGIKHHDVFGREIAVGTEPEARGRGLGRALVAQAARRIRDEGAIATYQHDPANLASARVAEAAGFPDRGWRSMGLFTPAA